MRALAFHYPREMPLTVPGSFDTRTKADETVSLGSPESLRIELMGLRPRELIVLETLGPGSGDAMTAWRELGEPEPLSREQTRRLREAARATTKESFFADDEGRFSLLRDLPPWSIVLLTSSGNEAVGAGEALS